MDIWTFILATLLLWRACRILSYEDGPAFLVQRFRILIGVVEDEDSLSAKNWIALLFTCPLCLSVWFALPLALVLGGGWLEWGALSGSASVLFRVTDRE